MGNKNSTTRILKEYHLPTLSIFYLVTRLPNLGFLPIFNDEAIWVDWGYRSINLKGFLFYSLMDAKPPFLLWIFGLINKIISDPLISGRFVSVIFGLFTLLGIYKIGRELFNIHTATVASILYVINPLFLFFDRQALFESAVAACGVWSFYFFYKLLKEDKKKYAFLFGLTLGLGYFIKSNFIIFILSLTILGLYYSLKQRGENPFRRIENLFVIFGVLFLTISPLLLQESFWISLSQNSKYALTFKEIIRFPLRYWSKNFLNILEITLVYFNPIFFIFLIISSIQLIKSKFQSQLLLSFFVCNLILLTLVARSVNPRYLVSFMPLSSLFIAHILQKFATKLQVKGITLIIFSLLPSIAISYLLVFQPLTYFNTLNNFSNHSQKQGYVVDWTSGYGFNDAKAYLENISAKEKIIVGVRSDAGIPENAVFAYFLKSKNITPIIFDSQILPPEIFTFDCIRFETPFYFVSRDAHLTNLNKFFEDVERFYKPEGNNFIGIHKLKTDCLGKTLEIN